MKTTGIVLLLFKVSFCLCEPKQLSPGDIAITGFNFRNPDQFSFISFTELTEGTVIRFTDCGWKSDNTFRPGEGIITYTAPPGGIPALKVITYNSDPGFTSEGVSGFFGFSVEGDQILVYQGDYSSPLFLFALNNNGNGWQTDATDNNSSSLPPGLISGSTAVALNESENQIYNCILETGDKNIILNAICDAQNWTGFPERLSLPGSCFDKALPITISDFSVSGTEVPVICYEVTCSGSCRLILEWSENGKDFQTVFKEEFFQDNRLSSCYNDPFHQSGYFRIHVQETGNDTYSKIQSFNPIKKQVFQVQLLTPEGKLLGEFSSLNESENFIKNIPVQKIIIRRILYQNEIKTEKLISGFN